METKDLIAGLAARAEQLSSPPRTWREAARAIQAKETILGWPHGAPIYDLETWSVRLHELDAAIAALAPTANPVAAKSPAAIRLEEYRRITDPFTKTVFYRKHAAEIDLAHREQAATPEPSRPSTGEPILDHLASLTDSVDRTTFYREHAAEIDSAHRRLKRANS